MKRIIKLKRFISIGLILLLTVVLMPSRVEAAITACTGTISPTSTTTNSSTNFQVSIQNTDSVAYQWIKITVPSSEFEITGYGLSGSFNATQDSTSITLSNGSLSVGSTQNLNVSVDVRNITVGDYNWIVQASSDPSGADPFTCTGSLTVTMTSGTDTLEPVISNVAINTANDTSVIITWTTDESASSNIDYGTTTAYGSTVSDTALTTSHSLTVTGLTKNTSYHSQVYSTDASGNTSYSSDFTFNTSSTQTTVTTTTVETKTVTKLVEDTEKPGISFTTKFDEPFSSIPTISGKVTDNAGIALVEYSSDGGENWLPVDETTGLQSKTVNFSFSLFGLLDGNYRIRVRATDLSANVYTTGDNILVFDRLPPAIGAVIYSLGSQILTPIDNTLQAVSGIEFKVSLSAVGGPTSVEIISNELSNDQATTFESFGLTKNKDTGLWSGGLVFDRPGRYELTGRSIDGAENEVINELGSIEVFPKGKITYRNRSLGGAKVTVYYLESSTGEFVVWDGLAYGQENPIKVDSNANYSIILPPGKYYLEIADSEGRLKNNTKIFDLDKVTLINSNFDLSVQRSFGLGPIAFTLPGVFQPALDVQIAGSGQAETKEDGLVGSEFPSFELTASDVIYDSFYFRGKPTVYSFLNTWLPRTSQQIDILEGLESLNVASVVVIPQESLSRVSIFKDIGNYSSLLLADPDGVLLSRIGVNNLPVHFLVDQKGIVVDIVQGVVTEEHVVDRLLSN